MKRPFLTLSLAGLFLVAACDGDDDYVPDGDDDTTSSSSSSSSGRTGSSSSSGGSSSSSGGSSSSSGGSSSSSGGSSSGDAGGDASDEDGGLDDGGLDDAGDGGGLTGLAASCTAIYETVSGLECEDELERDEYIATCIADADQDEGRCSDEYAADAACRAALPASDYECVGGIGLNEIGTCEETGDALIDCILGG